jgi:hypothetical protein
LRNATFTQGERIVAEQRKWFADLERERHDTRQSKELLAQSEEVQALHVPPRPAPKKALQLAGPRSLTDDIGVAKAIWQNFRACVSFYVLTQEYHAA